MTNLKDLSNFELVLDTKKSVLKERQAMMAVLLRLREIALRRVHIEMGYSSLHEFVVVESAAYSDGAAYRRVHAMKLCDELPEATQAIADGKLSLSNAASLEGFLKDQGDTLSTDEKLALLKAVEGKTKAQCDRIFYPEKTGKVIEFHADEQTLEDLNRLCELLAIAPSDMATLIKTTAKLALKAIDPILKKGRSMSKNRMEKKEGACMQPSQPQPSSVPSSGTQASPDGADKVINFSEKLEKLITPATPEGLSTKSKPVRKRIPAALKREVWQRDGSQCTYACALTGRRCSSRYGLQIDHRVPVACGGTNELENLRLLCFAHNALAAQRVFGRDKMNRYRVHGVS